MRIVNLATIDEDGNRKLFGYIECACGYEFIINDDVDKLRHTQIFVPECPRCHCAFKVSVVQGDIDTIERLGYGLSAEEREIMLLTAK